MNDELLAGRRKLRAQLRTVLTRDATEQSRKFGMTRMSQICSELAIRVAFRLSDTAVTPSDCSIENATVSEYERIGCRAA